MQSIRRRSIRFRLTAWYSIILAIAIAGFGFATFTILSRQLDNNTDEKLASTALAIQRNSQDYIELKKAGVKFYKTPDAILRAQLDAWDDIMKKKGAENALFKKVLDSQRAYAERAGAWQNDYMVDFRMAWNRYFGKGGKKA